MRKKKKIIFIGFSIILFLFFTYVFLSFTGVIREFRLKRESEPMIEKIEEYKIKNGFYPKKISDAGFPEPDESGPIYYQLEGSNNYIVWFGMDVGESVTYSSKTKSWTP